MCFSIVFVIVILFVVTINKLMNNEKKSSTFLSYGIKILSSFGLIVNTIIAFPIFNIFICVIICNNEQSIYKDLECYSGIYFIYLITAIFGAIFFTLLCFLYTILYIDYNPASIIPFA